MKVLVDVTNRSQAKEKQRGKEKTLDRNEGPTKLYTGI